MDRAAGHTAQASAGVSDVSSGLHGGDILHGVLMVPQIHGLS